MTSQASDELLAEWFEAMSRLLAQRNALARGASLQDWPPYLEGNVGEQGYIQIFETHVRLVRSPERASEIMTWEEAANYVISTRTEKS